ncbi:hypothetical protein Efla_000893 [Eimeria flavescens]
MQFVKSSVYQAEITEGGLREREVDTRSREEVELQERLRRLPEFSRSMSSKQQGVWTVPGSVTSAELPFVEVDIPVFHYPNFKSYAEQVWEGLPNTTPEPPPPSEGKQNPNLPHSVTEEEFEFYEALRAQDRRKKLARQREEDAMRDEFHKAREQSLKLSVGSAKDSRSSESEGSSLGGLGKPSPFAVLGAQKQRDRPAASALGEGSIFDVTTKVFQEKQRKRAIDVRALHCSLLSPSRAGSTNCGDSAVIGGSVSCSVTGLGTKARQSCERCLQVRRAFNLIIKKPKCEETAPEPSSAEAADRAAADKIKEAEKKEAREEAKPETSRGHTSDVVSNAFASLCEAYGDSDDSG